MVLKVPASMVFMTEPTSEGMCWVLPCKGCFFAVFFSRTLPEPQRKELVFEQHPCVKLTTGHGCFYHPVLALMCVWTSCGSDSAVLHSRSLLWGLPLVFWVGALGKGLVGLKHQHTQSILVLECLTLISSSAFWDVETCAPTRELWLHGYWSWTVPFPDCLDTAVCRAVECRGSGNSPVKSVFSLLFLLSPLTPWAAALFQVPEVMVFELFNSISKTNGC